MSDIRKRIERLEGGGGDAYEVAAAIETHDATGEWVGRPAVVERAAAIKEMILGMESNVLRKEPTGPTLRRHDS